MADDSQQGAQKDPDDWVTGDEPMTASQASYLQTLCQEAGEEFDEGLSKADASGGSTSSRSGPVAGARPTADTARPGQDRSGA